MKSGPQLRWLGSAQPRQCSQGLGDGHQGKGFESPDLELGIATVAIELQILALM